MSLYVYCLCEGLRWEAFEGLAGVGGRRVRVFEVGRLSAVLSELEDERVEVTRENISAHNHVNARVLSEVTPLPFRFGTRASETGLAEYVAANESALLSSLARVRGCVEMSVKIKWDVEERAGSFAEGKGQKAEGKSVEAEGAETGGVAGVGGAGREGGGSGTAFLLAKRREVLGDESRRRRAEEIAAWLASAVSPLARESAVRVSPSEALVVRASHLVGRERVAEYRGRVRSLREERSGLRFLTSGPWPPYSFAQIERR